jgi:hypothetical protein
VSSSLILIEREIISLGPVSPLSFNPSSGAVAIPDVVGGDCFADPDTHLLLLEFADSKIVKMNLPIDFIVAEE